MIHFNSNTVEGGFIKQLLSSYNLPTVRIYNPEKFPLFEKQLYIKGNAIIQYLNGQEHFVSVYKPNMYLPNFTSKLSFKGLAYDTSTHEYLGNYLRFIRDFYHYDLMSMYNCYSNNFPNLLQTKFNVDIGELKNQEVIFNTRDKTYKIIMVPVRVGYNYTIAIDSMSGIEMFVGMYNSAYKALKNLNSITYQKISYTRFDKPIIYDKLAKYKYDIVNNRNTDIKNTLWTSSVINEAIAIEKDLKLFIKIPFENNSSITILEGTYQECKAGINFNNSFASSIPRVVFNEVKQVDPIREMSITTSDLENIKLPNKNQLLISNTNISHPFAERLIEYLTDNVIGPMDKISDNIKRVQMDMVRNFNDNRTIKTNTPLLMEDGSSVPQQVWQSTSIGLQDLPRYYGKWSAEYKLKMYNLAHQKQIIAKYSDLLGYVDKDIESALGEEFDIYAKEEE